MSDKHHRKTSDTNENPMPAEAFREWRKRLGLKQKDAADLLGLKKRMIQYYETGSRSGKHVSIPKSIRLACYALEAGVGDYDGEHVIGEAPIGHGYRPPNVLPIKRAEAPLGADDPSSHTKPPALPVTANESE